MRTTLRTIAILSVILVIAAAPASAQESETDGATYQLPRGWVTSPTPGLVREPSILSKLAMSTDTGIGGAPRDGLYAELGNMITGAGWISAGPGYRRAILDGRGR